jgi:hypothetical protein
VNRLREGYQVTAAPPSSAINSTSASGLPRANEPDTVLRIDLRNRPRVRGLVSFRIVTHHSVSTHSCQVRWLTKAIGGFMTLRYTHSVAISNHVAESAQC